MRDRLIEIFKKTKYSPVKGGLEATLATQFSEYALNQIIDKLLAEGVIVPPVKVGQTVYVITEKHPCYACKWCGDFCHKDCHIKNKSELVVKKAKVFYFLFQEMHKEMRLEVEETEHLQMHFLHFNLDDIGKTVFLTREEAERALERSENGKS